MSRFDKFIPPLHVLKADSRYDADFAVSSTETEMSFFTKFSSLAALQVAVSPLQWRHNECDGDSNHQRQDCLLNCVFRRRSKKISKLRVTGLCERNSPVTGEFPSQMASNSENVSIRWRHHDTNTCLIDLWHLSLHHSCGAIACGHPITVDSNNGCIFITECPCPMYSW